MRTYILKLFEKVRCMNHPRREASFVLLTQVDKVSAELCKNNKEMLSIVATLEEFWSILLGAVIHIFINYKNLTFNTLKTQCLLLWHTKIEKFSPMLHYIEGPLQYSSQ